MAIKDNRLKEFFSKQKVGAFDSLVKKNNPIVKKQDGKEINAPLTAPIDELINQETLTKVLVDSEQGLSSIAQCLENTNQITEIKPLAIRDQSVSNPLAIRKQSVSKPLAIGEQTVSEPLSDPLAKPLANTEEIHITDLIIFSKKERELLFLIFGQCRNHGALISPPISTEEIRNTLKISAERVRNLIHRILKKGGLKILQHRSGQSAYRIFELPKAVYQLIDQANNLVKKFNEPLAHPLADPLANFAYSSSSYNKNITTSLPEDWKKINFDLLSHIGFSETQLHQLHSSNMTSPEIVQEAINRFAYSLEHSQKVKAYHDPLNVLMGVLRKGQRWVEPNYVPPRELALNQLLEEKRKQKEKRDLMVKEYIELEFPDWRRRLTQEQIQEMVPTETLKANLAPAITAALRSYFVEKVLLPRFEMNDASII